MALKNPTNRHLVHLNINVSQIKEGYRLNFIRCFKICVYLLHKKEKW